MPQLSPSFAAPPKGAVCDGMSWYRDSIVASYLGSLVDSSVRIVQVSACKKMTTSYQTALHLDNVSLLNRVDNLLNLIRIDEPG